MDQAFLSDTLTKQGISNLQVKVITISICFIQYSRAMVMVTFIFVRPETSQSPDLPKQTLTTYRSTKCAKLSIAFSGGAA
jgi:hypothetical protein